MCLFSLNTAQGPKFVTRGFGIGIEIGEWDWRLGIGDWDWGLEIGIGD